jgi:hypothetical protein
MLLWYVVYRDKPQQEAPDTEERAPDAAVFARFDDAARLGIHNGRGVLGMWLIDGSAEQGDVVRCHGLVPLKINARYEAYLDRATAFQTHKRLSG